MQDNQRQIVEMMNFKKDQEMRLTKAEFKIIEMEEKLKHEEVINLKMEMERLSYLIRFQTWKIQKKDDLFSIISEALAEFMETEAEEVSNEIDQVYEVGNLYTKRNSFPREVHIKCVRKGFRDEVFLQARKKEMKINQKEVKIIKDIPWRIRMKRKNY